jgi:NADH dehydrogenase
MVEAAGRAGVERFVFFSALGACADDRTRLLRSKALAERAVRDGPVESVILAPSLIYAPGDRWLTLLARLSLLPAVPIPGRGRAVYQPIWADDVARCVSAVLEQAAAPGSRRYELAGPQTLSHEAIVRLAIRAQGKRRPILRVPTPIVSRGLRALELVARSRAFATWDEAELMEVSMVSADGTAGARALGVQPRAMADVLGVQPRATAELLGVRPA